MVLPVLVLLNGIPGSGKSTLARSWAARQPDPLALVLDVDVVRGMLGRWSEAALPAGLAARAMAVAAIEVHLRAGRDVMVPQYLRREDFIEELREVAVRAGARFVECVLVVDAVTASDRLTARTAPDAASGVEGRLDESVAAVHEDFARFLATRHHAVVLDDGSVASLEAVIDAARSGSDRGGASTG